MTSTLRNLLGRHVSVCLLFAGFLAGCAHPPQQPRPRELLGQSPTLEAEPRAKASSPAIEQGRSLYRLIIDLASDKPERAIDAARHLRLMGPDAARAVPGLMLATLRGDEDLRQECYRALKKIGPAFDVEVDRLAVDLGSENRLSRLEAVEQLAALNALAGRALPELLTSLTDKSDPFHQSALRAIQRAEPSADLLPRLLPLLRHEDPEVRSTTILTIGKLGATAASIKDPLQSALADSNPLVRLNAAATLVSIDPESEAGWNYFLSVIRGTNLQERRDAIERAGSLGHGAQRLVPLLFQGLKDPDPWVRVHAAKSIARIKPWASNLVLALTQGLYDSNPKVRELYAETLGELGATSASAVPALRRTLADTEPWVRTYAAQALGRIGPSAREAIPELIAALRDPVSSVQDRALEALHEFLPLQEDQLLSLVPFLRHKTVAVRSFTATSLRYVKTRISEVTAPLEDSLEDESPEVRRAAMESLALLREKEIPASAPIPITTKKDRRPVVIRRYVGIVETATSHKLLLQDRRGLSEEFIIPDNLRIRGGTLASLKPGQRLLAVYVEDTKRLIRITVFPDARL